LNLLEGQPDGCAEFFLAHPEERAPLTHASAYMYVHRM